MRDHLIDRDDTRRQALRNRFETVRHKKVAVLVKQRIECCHDPVLRLERGQRDESAPCFKGYRFIEAAEPRVFQEIVVPRHLAPPVSLPSESLKNLAPLALIRGMDECQVTDTSHEV